MDGSDEGRIGSGNFHPNFVLLVCCERKKMDLINLKKSAASKFFPIIIDSALVFIQNHLYCSFGSCIEDMLHNL
ncbi:hypothetical protein BpHYR1_046117 [Brachionus plicatilis]|uniref:Uncharacterized protein n=1 Tax=Brachionus plicatilis TaxID=10195 RepID=A0A3M7QNJ0_BRAPC|nr:hypothetical protein BpHYR1_046117 [Brachionus plicatilis]